jgi:pilus assembly protein CpaB
VLVATQEIPKNTPGAAIASEGFFKPTQIAAKQVTAGALADAGALQGKVAAQDIYPGEQLTAADFAAGGGLTASLAPTQRAMTVSLDAEHGMIGQLHDGDHVDVYAGVDLAQNAGGVNRPVLRLLMSNVVVLQAATSNGGSLGGGGNANSTAQVTLRVDDSEAAELAFAADNGKVWLALRPGNASAPPAPALTDVQSFLSASQPIAAGGAGK